MLCANCAWSTVGTDDPIDSDRLLEICHVKLVYIGHNMFGELREKTVLTIPPMLTSHSAIGAASTSVSGINQTRYNINVGLEPPPNIVPEDNVPPVDTLDYIDSSDFSDLEGSSEDTIIYPSLDNTTHKTPFLNVDDTTDRPIGTGYYTKVNNNSETNIGDTPRSDIYLSANTKNKIWNENTTNQEEIHNNIVETPVSVLGSNDDIPRNDVLQGINVMHTVSVSGVNTENVSGSVFSSNGNVLENDHVKGINSPQNSSVSGLNTQNITEDHNCAVKSTNTVNMTCTSKENSDVNGMNSPDPVQSVPCTEGTSTIDEHPDTNELTEPVDSDENTDGNSSTDTVSKLHNLFLVKNPESALYKLWKRDAIKNRLSVKIIKMDKDEIYYMSHPTPNWLEIDPYSSLEEVISDTEDKINNVSTQNNNQEESLTSDKYYMRERKVKQPLWTLCSVVVHNYMEDSDDDSDYTPVTRSVKNSNIGLRNPSKE